METLNNSRTAVNNPKNKRPRVATCGPMATSVAILFRYAPIVHQLRDLKSRRSKLSGTGLRETFRVEAEGQADERDANDHPQSGASDVGGEHGYSLRCAMKPGDGVHRVALRPAVLA